jgi:hypothetical protein
VLHRDKNMDVHHPDTPDAGRTPSLPETGDPGMSRTTTKVLALTAASGLAVVGFFLTKPAFAGSNGQQVQVCQQLGEDYTQALIQGTNQNGEFTSATVGITPGGCGTLTGYYWVGDVLIGLRISNTSATNRSAYCNVPKEHEGAEVITCFV